MNVQILLCDLMQQNELSLEDSGAVIAVNINKMSSKIVNNITFLCYFYSINPLH